MTQFVLETTISMLREEVKAQSILLNNQEELLNRLHKALFYHQEHMEAQQKSIDNLFEHKACGPVVEDLVGSVAELAYELDDKKQEQLDAQQKAIDTLINRYQPKACLAKVLEELTLKVNELERHQTLLLESVALLTKLDDKKEEQINALDTDIDDLIEGLNTMGVIVNNNMNQIMAEFKELYKRTRKSAHRKFH